MTSIPLILALGSNLGDRLSYLQSAREMLETYFKKIAYSPLYESCPVDFLEQPLFINQMAQYETTLPPLEVLTITKKIETELGRKRLIAKGPRTIDIDIIFYAYTTLSSDLLTLPHPRWSQRAFVLKPLKDLPFYNSLAEKYPIDSLTYDEQTLWPFLPAGPSKDALVHAPNNKTFHKESPPQFLGPSSKEDQTLSL